MNASSQVGMATSAAQTDASRLATSGAGLPDPMALLGRSGEPAARTAAGSGSVEIDAVEQGFGQEIDKLAPQFGEKNVTDAIGQLFKSTLSEQMISLLEREGSSLGLSPVEIDAIVGQLREDAKASAVSASSPVAQAVQREAGAEIDSLVQMVIDGWRDQLLDENKRGMNGPGGYSQGAAGGAGATSAAGGDESGGADAAGGAEGSSGEAGASDAASGAEGSGSSDKASESGGAGGTSGSATDNWLVVLASILGKASGKHLKATVDLGEQMGSIDSEQDPEKFAQLNAEFQAETQIFKLFQEAIGTMIKSIGEGMSTVARKM